MFGKGRVVHQTISDTDATISSLLGGMLVLQGELNQAVMFHTALLSNEMRDNIDRLREREQYCHKMCQLTPSISTISTPRKS